MSVQIPRSIKFQVMSALFFNEFWTEVVRSTEVTVTLGDRKSSAQNGITSTDRGTGKRKGKEKEKKNLQTTKKKHGTEECLFARLQLQRQNNGNRQRQHHDVC